MYWRSRREPTQRVIVANRPDGCVPAHLDNTISTRRYSWLTFPLSLLYQFRRASNVYFLFMVVLVLIPGIAPVSPISTIFPLVFVLAVSETREFVEEFQAAKRDRATNECIVNLLTGKRIQSKALKPGDIVLLKRDDRVPSDILVLQTAAADGSVYVETASLDGETNLKVRKCPSLLKSAELGSLTSLRVTITCEPPHVDMYSFSGIIETKSGDHESLSINNIMWRGCTVRNTAWVAGLVVYTGADCKVMLYSQSGLTPSKTTCVDSQMNQNVITIVLIQVIICAICASVGSSWFGDNLPWYLEGISGMSWFPLFFSFFVLLGNLIPVSLWVSVELLKVAQAIMIERDPLSSIKCNSKIIHEELGRISYVFSDKTGTLTVNKMKFVGANVEGKRYLLSNEDGSPETVQEAEQNAVLPFPGVLSPSKDLVEVLSEAVAMQGSAEAELFTALALCHSCERIMEPFTGKLSNQSSSPDEAALVSTAAEVGVVFTSRPAPDVITLTRKNSGKEEYKILQTIPFTSERRMMTVVVRKIGIRNPIFAFSKGADSSIFHIASHGPIDEAKQAVATFSHYGYRTLCVSAREFSESEWSSISSDLSKARKSCDSEVIEKLNNFIESDMRLIGSTAVEDRLQDGVPETLCALKAAEIKVCMITGDKRETAINIAMSCGLISCRRSVYLMLGSEQAVGGIDGLREGETTKESSYTTQVMGGGCFVPLKCLEEIIRNKEWTSDAVAREYWMQELDSIGMTALPRMTSREISREEPVAREAATFSLVIDGKNLKSILASPASTQHLVNVLSFRQCEAVVFCRVSPKQKGEIVKLIQKQLGAGASTLAIGDGANDINMINIANVGVGIAGNEGAQAANSSDYAVGEFKDLYRLLFAHGRYNYRRTTRFISLFLYKNFAFTICQLWFATLSAFSAQTASESAYLLLFNSVFGIIPLFVFGTLDKDVNIDSPKFQNYEYWKDVIVPKLYKSLEIFSFSSVSRWCLLGLIHSVFVFFGVWLTWGYPMSSIDGKGAPPSLWMASILVYTSEIFLVSVMTLFISASWTKLLIWSVVICNICAYFGFVLVYDLMHLKGTTGYVWSMAESTLLNFQFWFILFLITALMVLPLIGWNQVKRFFNEPNLLDAVRAKLVALC